MEKKTLQDASILDKNAFLDLADSVTHFSFTPYHDAHLHLLTGSQTWLEYARHGCGWSPSSAASILAHAFPFFASLLAASRTQAPRARTPARNSSQKFRRLHARARGQASHRGEGATLCTTIGPTAPAGIQCSNNPATGAVRRQRSPDADFRVRPRHLIIQAHKTKVGHIRTHRLTLPRCLSPISILLAPTLFREDPWCKVNASQQTHLCQFRAARRAQRAHPSRSRNQ